MAIFQANTGYRDASKSLTIKALEARMKAAQEASAQSTQMQQPISDPWQGAAYLGNILASGVGEIQAQHADINARDQLSKIKAGIDWSKGPDAQQYADMGRLDPEGADKIMQDWVNYRQDMAKQEAQNKFTTGRDVSQEALREQGDVKQGEIATAENIRKEGVAITQEQQKNELALKQNQAEVDQRKAQWLQEHPGDDMSSREAQSFILMNKQPVADPMLRPAFIKETLAMKDQADTIDNSLDGVKEAQSLVPKALTGTVATDMAALASKFGEPGIAALTSGSSWVGEMFPSLKGLTITRDQIVATNRLQQLLGTIAANRAKSQVGARVTNFEFGKLSQLFSSSSATPDQKMQALNDMEKALHRGRDSINATIVGYNGQPLDPYVYSNPGGLNISSDATNPAAAAALGGDGAAGGGGTAAPAPRDPNTMTREERDKELADLKAKQAARQKGQ